MNIDPNNERLLAEVLAEETDPAVRAASLEHTLHLVRRRRHFRRISRASSAIAVLAGLLLLVWRFLPVSPSLYPPANRPYTLVRTKPLPPTAILRTSPFPSSAVVASARDPQMVVIRTTARNIPEVMDDELLALAASAPAVLVRNASQAAELVFSNPSDGETFLRN